jgi:hypothetical protein
MTVRSSIYTVWSICQGVTQRLGFWSRAFSEVSGVSGVIGHGVHGLRALKMVGLRCHCLGVVV